MVSMSEQQAAGNHRLQKKTNTIQYVSRLTNDCQLILSDYIEDYHKTKRNATVRSDKRIMKPWRVNPVPRSQVCHKKKPRQGGAGYQSIFFN
jgi:hypothetical protein